MRRRVPLTIMGAILLIIITLSVFPAAAQSNNGERLVVSSNGPYLTIEAALDVAQDGDVIEVHGGVYDAPLVIETSVSFIGIDNPVIDGGGEGSLVIISAPGVLFQGFTLRNTGSSLANEDTGIVVQAPDAVVSDNLLEEVLFGIYFANADNSIARNNVVRGIDLDDAMRGDGIRVWYTNNAVLDSNTVTTARDTLIWFADDITIENNEFIDNRYGLHFMYSSNALVQGNTFEGNSVGTYLMYSDSLTMRENIMAYNRGPSGYGLALKAMDDVTAIDNLFIGNRAGVYMDNSPTSVESYNSFTGNFLAYNDIGVVMQPSVQRNIFQSNSFLENLQQAGTRGRGTLQGNIWHQDGIGNYWSDYAGYDVEGDGIGDFPYRSENLFESLTDSHPVLQLFVYSPASQAIDFAGAAFPSLRPDPKLVDEAPMTQYVLPAHLTAEGEQVSVSLFVASLILVGLGGGVCIFALWFALPRRNNLVPAQPSNQQIAG